MISEIKKNDLKTAIPKRYNPKNKQHSMDNGNVFYGEKGYMILHRARRWQVYWKDGEKGPHSQPKNDRGKDHRENFIECVRTRQRPVADIELGFHSSALAHFGNTRASGRSRSERRPVIFG